MRHDREPFEGGSYDDGEDVAELGGELLDCSFDFVGEDFTGGDFVGDVGRDPFEGAQLND